MNDSITETTRRFASELAIIIVSYNVRDLLRRCLQSIEASCAASGPACTIIVVDNASHDGSVAMVRAEFPAVQVIALDTNVGFAGGNNVGLRWLMDAAREVANGEDIRAGRYVLLLNPDTEVVGAALHELVRYVEDHPEVVVVGPQLRYGDGALQSSRRRFPTVGTLFWESTLLEQWWPHNPWAQRYRYGDQPVMEPQAVDWLVGAALLVRLTAIDQAGLLDEQFFMYSEELEWQQRLGRYGSIVYVPSAVVTHYEGKSSEQNLARRHVNFNRSKLRYARLRFGVLVSWLLRVFLLITYGVQLVIEAAKWLLGHKRSLRRQRIVQYSAILRSGL